MTLDALASDIATQVKKEAKAITDAAKKEAKGIVSEAKSEADARREEAIAKAERECAQIQRETVASARQANQKDLLIARREELDATLAAVREQVGSASMAGRAALLKALVAEAKEQGEAGMILRPVEIDRAALEKAGGGYDFGDGITGLGGFMLESADGSIVLDYRFDGRLETAWNNNLGEVSAILFGK